MRFICSVFLGFVLFISAFSLGVVLIVRDLPQTISTIVIENTNMTAAIADGIKQYAGSPEAPPAFTQAFNEINAAEIQDLLENEAVIVEIEHLVIDFAEAVIEGNANEFLENLDIIETIKTVEDEITEAFGYTLTDEDYKALAEYIQDADNLIMLQEMLAVQGLWP
jgi:hypothetical protein